MDRIARSWIGARSDPMDRGSDRTFFAQIGSDRIVEAVTHCDYRTTPGPQHAACDNGICLGESVIERVTPLFKVRAPQPSRLRHVRRCQIIKR
jgi:hypothetical protein